MGFRLTLHQSVQIDSFVYSGQKIYQNQKFKFHRPIVRERRNQKSLAHRPPLPMQPLCHTRGGKMPCPNQCLRQLALKHVIHRLPLACYQLSTLNSPHQRLPCWGTATGCQNPSPPRTCKMQCLMSS